MTRAEAAHKSRLALLGCALCHHIHGPHEPGPVLTINILYPHTIRLIKYSQCIRLAGPMHHFPKPSLQGRTA